MSKYNTNGASPVLILINFFLLFRYNNKKQCSSQVRTKQYEQKVLEYAYVQQTDANKKNSRMCLRAKSR